jgi:outer membrane lipopolysaccharide assembly protein LptE/RlpB
MTFLVRLTVVLLVAVVGGCGFQLRGQVEGNRVNPESQVSIRVVGLSPYSEFATQLNSSLAAAGINSGSDADLTLIVKPVEFSQNTLTVGESLRIADYDIRGQVRYQLIFRDDPNTAINEMAASDEFERIIEASQRLEYDPEAPLASRTERDLIERELQQELANRLTQRVALRIRAIGS